MHQSIIKRFKDGSHISSLINERLKADFFNKSIQRSTTVLASTKEFHVPARLALLFTQLPQNSKPPSTNPTYGILPLYTDVSATEADCRPGTCCSMKVAILWPFNFKTQPHGRKTSPAFLALRLSKWHFENAHLGAVHVATVGVSMPNCWPN